MRNRSLIAALLLSCGVAYAGAGLSLVNRDLSVRPQDDFYQYVNGSWLATVQIPVDKSGWGAFNELRESSLDDLHQILLGLEAEQAKGGNSFTPDQTKILALYQSYMNESALDQLGSTPINGLWAKIDQLQNKKQIPALLAELSKFGVTTPYTLQIHQDAKNSSVVVADLVQDGLGLPDRDYYLKSNESAMLKTRIQYQEHIAKMLALAGAANSAQVASKILKLETELATIQWTKVANRDPQKTYNKYSFKQLAALGANYPWHDYLSAAGINSKVNYVIISQPSYIQGFNQLLATVPLTTWKEYFKWQTLSAFAPDLSAPFANENFAFYGSALRGTPQIEARWKRGIALVNNQIGEGFGKLYVAKYFPEQNKQKMADLVANLLVVYRQGIQSLDWMSAKSKVAAQAKLSALMLKIAYPDHWRDYSALTIDRNDLVGNIMRGNWFEYQRNINKLGHPVDRSEWEMTPQTVNAYYNPEMNEIVFPAGILQAPFFNPAADDAVNYGGIGAVIGHEISHAFDDQGSQYDAKGNLHDWLSKEDHQRFSQKTKVLVQQYSAYSPVPGYPVNGELTLGENIADNSGLKIAYRAYQLSLAGKPAPQIDGFSGVQRFYFSWASVWRAKFREKQQIVLLKSDPHSPAAVRGNATLRNQDGFYSAFGLKPDDKMYLPAASRVNIW